MKFCNKCGTELVVGNTTCPSCGNISKEIEDLSLWRYFVKCLKNIHNFKGRASIKEYWGFVLFLLPIGSILSIIISKILWISIRPLLNSNNIIFSTTVTAIVFGVTIELPRATVLIRRLHDTGESGLLIIVYYLLMSMLLFATYMSDLVRYTFLDSAENVMELNLKSTSMFGIFFIIFLLGKIIFFALLKRKGNKGLNKYGHDPLG